MITATAELYIPLTILPANTGFFGSLTSMIFIPNYSSTNAKIYYPIYIKFTYIEYDSVSTLATIFGLYGSLTSIILKPALKSATNAKIFSLISIVLTPPTHPSVTILPTKIGFYGSLISIIFKPSQPSATIA